MNRIVNKVLLGCALAGILTVTHLRAQDEAPVARSQTEFDALGRREGADLNALGHAFDNTDARLFWFTDLDAAKAQARREGKPILSLRMLGRLSDDLSCANSRFFRTALYPNARVNRILRDKFVLHWSSERPVPVVTIDMGDGRVLKRTLTGNSAHYLMDASGAVLDVLPGLYGPGAFEKWLQAGLQLDADWKGSGVGERANFLRQWHQSALEAIYQRQADAQSGSVTETQKARFVQSQTRAALQNRWETASSAPTAPDETFRFVPRAEDASRIAVPKMMAEMPLLSATAPRSTTSPTVSPSERLRLNRFARTFEDDARLDAASRALLRAKLPAPVVFGVAQNAPSTPETTLARFEDALTFDTARNELDFHTAIHALFARGKQGDFPTLNRALYDHLFLTPASDPWLGLLPEGVYNGLQNGGVVSPDAQRVRTAQNVVPNQ